MSSIFISHSSLDEAAARELGEYLAERGHGIFLDVDLQRGIVAGSEWERVLYRHLRGCQAVVVLCSPASMASKWCFVEITHARALGKPLFPVKIAECELDGVLTDRQVVDLTTDRRAGLERLDLGLLAAGLDPMDAFDWDPGRSPYPGLLAFQERDAAVFCGRDREIGHGLETLNRVRHLGDTSLVLVLGASGSGKSSLVRAGLLPRLRRDVDRWLVLEPVRPRSSPFAELAANVSRAFGALGWPRPAEGIEERLRGTSEPIAEPSPEPAAGSPPTSSIEPLEATLEALEGSLGGRGPRVRHALRRLRDALGASPSARSAVPAEDSPLLALAAELRRASGRSEARILLVVDQFEELLGPGAAGEAQSFLSLLRTAVEQPTSPVIVLATMRSDFLDSFQRSRELRGLSHASLSLGPMSRDRVVEVIRRPAEVAGIELGRGLVQALVEDAAGGDSLPLLAFTLRRLYDEYGDDKLLELSEYRDGLGGLEKAVARAAEDLLAAERRQGRLDGDSENLLRKAFLRMVRPTEGGGFARRTTAWSRLPEEIHPLLERFVDARLLVSGEDAGERTLEVAHEALFDSWEPLRRWLDESAEALRLRQEIRNDALRWDEAAAPGSGERPRDQLWRGGRLTRARELSDAGELDLEPVERDFVEASRRAEQADADERDRRRRRELARARRFALVLGVAFLVALGLGLAAWVARKLALEAEQRADASAREAAREAVAATRNAVELEDRLASLNRVRYKSVRKQMEDRVDALAAACFEAWWPDPGNALAVPRLPPRPGAQLNRRAAREAARLAGALRERSPGARPFFLEARTADACPETARYLDREGTRIVAEWLVSRGIDSADLVPTLPRLEISLASSDRALCPIAEKFLAQARERFAQAGVLRERLGVLRERAGLPPAGSGLLLTLDVMRLRDGTGFALLFGDPASPRIMLFDGGPVATYERTLAPRFEELRQRWWPGAPIPFDLVVSTQSDIASLGGLQKLFEALGDDMETGEPPSLEVAGLWSNAFPADDPAMMRNAASFWRKLALHRTALALDIPFNRPFGRFVTLPAAGAARVGWPVRDVPGAPGEEPEELRITVLGPPLEWLQKYFDDYVADYIRRRMDGEEEVSAELVRALEDGFDVVEDFRSDRLELPPASPLAALDAPVDESEDRSLPNLASMVLMLELAGRKVFITSDARADTLLAAASQGGYTDETGAMEVDVLFLPHHGSDRNVSTEFFRRIRARHYVIQANGRHGNPDLATFARLFEGRREDSQPFSIHMNYAPEELPEGDRRRKYPVDELCDLVRAERERGRAFHIVTPTEGALSMSIDLLDAAGLDRSVTDRACGLDVLPVVAGSPE